MSGDKIALGLGVVNTVALVGATTWLHGRLATQESKQEALHTEVGQINSYIRATMSSKGGDHLQSRVAELEAALVEQARTIQMLFAILRDRGEPVSLTDPSHRSRGWGTAPTPAVAMASKGETHQPPDPDDDFTRMAYEIANK